MELVTYDYPLDIESSHGPTSRTTTGQYLKMSTSDKLKKLMTEMTDELLQEKEEEIKRLAALNDKLKEENDRLKQQVQFKVPDQFTNRNGEVIRKATELKKALDDYLGQEHPNRRQFQTFTPITIPNSVSDVNKSSAPTSESSKPFRSGPVDDLLMNGTSHTNHGIHNSYQEPNHDFSTRQDFRLESDQDIINAATELPRPLPFHSQQGHNSHSGHNGHNSFVPTTLNNGTGRRFHMTGINNSNNRSRSHNNNNNNNNSNNNSISSGSKYTIFIAWSGSVASVEQVRDLFDPNDIVDIRYTHPKQFAHVDLKTENAMNKAMLLNGTIKTESQGTLRVETGKPRSSNTTENGQRPQNQTRNYNNNRQNNKNVNGGFNNGLQPGKKFNPNSGYGNHNNRSNHGGQYPNFVPTGEKENGTNGASGATEWQNYAANSSVSNQDLPKPNES